jgi:hypothetical protein
MDVVEDTACGFKLTHYRDERLLDWESTEVVQIEGDFGSSV